MIFEGPEKKLEIFFRPGCPPLRGLGRPFWEKVVAATHAKILSAIENECQTAFLLSESSLFVFDSRLLMITCGQTALVNALKPILEGVGRESVDLLFFERKNENFPDAQPSDFHADLKALRSLFPGDGFRFGGEQSDHIFLFHSEAARAEAEDQTLEILMHEPDLRVMKKFSQRGAGDVSRLAEIAPITACFPEFEVDEFVFSPAGYSMNGIHQGHYYTIHVTPQKQGSYVSFETNHPGTPPEELINQVLAFFNPRRAAIVHFKPGPSSSLPAKRGYRARENITYALKCGYNIHFQNLVKSRRSAPPVEKSGHVGNERPTGGSE